MKAPLTDFDPRRRFGLELEVVLKDSLIRNSDYDLPEDDPDYDEDEAREAAWGDVSRAIGRLMDDIFILDRVEDYFSNNDPTDRHWYAKSDSSIRGPGCEIVTPALRGEDGLQELLQGLKAIRRYFTVNTSTGLHVHHDVKDFTDSQLLNLYRVYFSFQPVIMYLVSGSRRMNNYCPALEKCVESFGLTERECKDHLLMSQRYALNLESVSVRGTVEFRQHNGTLADERVLPWLYFTQAIVSYAKEVKNVKQLREVDLYAVLRRLGWSGSHLSNARIRWAREMLETRFASFAKHPRKAPVKIGV